MKGFIYFCFLLALFGVAAGIDIWSFVPKFLRFGHKKNVSYNPDVDLDTLGIIRRAGYPAEAHAVVTDDGYILTIHRIPGKIGSPPVLVQHGLLCSSDIWVISGKGKALAFLLADHGYDVWLGNFRGNTYSLGHVSLSNSDPKYWNFSFHEMGLHDLPTMVNYITNMKNDSLIYIGHSMGTTSFYVMSSHRSDISQKVKMMFSLAPVAFMNHLKSPIRLLAPFAHDLQALYKLIGANEFLPSNYLIKILAKFGCELTTLEKEICSNVMFAICGFDSSEFDYSLMPVILSHMPAGASTKTIVHYAQEVMSGKFGAYDYGAKENMNIYNSTEPPDYDLSKVSAETIFYYADNDWLSSVTDVNKLAMKLPKLPDMNHITFKKFNHLDYLWARDAPKLIYYKIIQRIGDYYNESSIN